MKAIETVFRYNVVHCNMILHMLLQWLGQNTNKGLNGELLGVVCEYIGKMTMLLRLRALHSYVWKILSGKIMYEQCDVFNNIVDNALSKIYVNHVK